MNDALNKMETALLSSSTWANRKSRLRIAKVKWFTENDGLSIAKAELQQLLDEYGKADDDYLPERERNSALEAASFLAQVRRYVPCSPVLPAVAQQWIELIPEIALLHIKGINLHEQALNKYQLSTNLDELGNTMHEMREAIEIREQLGHMRGLVASLNVLGSMHIRHVDWNPLGQMTEIRYAAQPFRHSIEYSDKHASRFDQFQGRIHLAVCLFRHPSVAGANAELLQLFDYFQTQRTDDLRAQVESEFYLASSVFIRPTLSLEEMLDHGQQRFEELANKYS